MGMYTLSRSWSLPSDRLVSPLRLTSFLGPFRYPLVAVEMQETADAVVVTAHLSGIRPAEVAVTASGQTLTLAGQQRLDGIGGYGDIVGYRYFEQTLPLPVRVDDRQIQQAFHGDRLVITCSKAEHPERIGERGGSGPNASYSTSSNGLRWLRGGWANGWRQARHWLGRQLQTAGRRLLQS